MTEEKADHYSTEFWNQSMGRDLPRSKNQPLQPVRIENGKLKLFAGVVNSRFSSGTKVGLQLSGNRIALEEATDGESVQEASFWDEGRFVEFELSEAIREVLPKEEPVFGILPDDTGAPRGAKCNA